MSRRLEHVTSPMIRITLTGHRLLSSLFVCFVVGCGDAPPEPPPTSRPTRDSRRVDRTYPPVISAEDQEQLDRHLKAHRERIEALRAARAERERLEALPPMEQKAEVVRKYFEEGEIDAALGELYRLEETLRYKPTPDGQAVLDTFFDDLGLLKIVDERFRWVSDPALFEGGKPWSAAREGLNRVLAAQQALSHFGSHSHDALRIASDLAAGYVIADFFQRSDDDVFAPELFHVLDDATSGLIGLVKGLGDSVYALAQLPATAIKLLHNYDKVIDSLVGCVLDWERTANLLKNWATEKWREFLNADAETQGRLIGSITADLVIAAGTANVGIFGRSTQVLELLAKSSHLASATKLARYLVPAARSAEVTVNNVGTVIKRLGIEMSHNLRPIRSLDDVRAAIREIATGQIDDSFTARQAAMLASEGFNISAISRELLTHSRIGPDGTFLTDRKAIESIIGRIDSKVNRLTITKAVANQVESALGLTPPGRLSSNRRALLSIVDKPLYRYPRSPITGNGLFLGPGKGLPGGGPEVVVPAIPFSGGPGIRQIIIEIE